MNLFICEIAYWSVFLFLSKINSTKLASFNKLMIQSKSSWPNIRSIFLVPTISNTQSPGYPGPPAVIASLNASRFLPKYLMDSVARLYCVQGKSALSRPVSQLLMEDRRLPCKCQIDDLNLSTFRMFPEK